MFSKDWGFLLLLFSSLGLMTPPVCFSHCSYSFMAIQKISIKHQLRARHCVGSKESGSFPHGMYSRHIQRYICGEKKQFSTTGT